MGHTMEYVKVAVQSEEDLSNRLEKVKISGLLTDEIMLAILEK